MVVRGGSDEEKKEGGMRSQRMKDEGMRGWWDQRGRDEDKEWMDGCDKGWRDERMMGQERDG